MTSIFGSVINFCILEYIMILNSISISYIAVLGDDIDVSLDRVEDAEKIFKNYKDIGFPVS